MIQLQGIKIIAVALYFTIIILRFSGGSQEQSPCISELTDLETLLLDHQGNIENLTKAFLPPNQPSPIVVKVCYYVEPAIIPSTERDCEYNATYAFRWSTSPLFLYTNAQTLRALTFDLAQITEQTTVLSINASICDLLHLNYITTLLKAYTSVRGSSEIDETSVGSVAFYNASVNNFLLLVGRTNLARTPLLLAITAALLTCCAALGVPMAVYMTYNQLGADQSGVNCKYFIKGFVLVLFVGVPAAIVYDLWNIAVIDIESLWTKIFVLVVGTIAVLFSFITGFFIVYMKTCRGNCTMSRRSCLCMLVQSLSIGLLIAFSELLALHGMFNVMFLLLIASPQHITVSVVFYGTGFFSCVVITALMLVLLDDCGCCACSCAIVEADSTSTAQNDTNATSTTTTMEIEEGNLRTGISTYLGTFYVMLFFIAVYLFLVSFIYCFSEFISVVNSGSSESYIATLTPSVILAVVGAFLTYIIRRKTQKTAQKPSLDNIIKDAVDNVD